MAAIRHYYDVEAEARKTGNGSPIDSVTTGPNSLASQNFKAFIAQQTGINRRSVILENHFSDWSIKESGDEATASYTFWLQGHDTDAASGEPVEPDNITSKRDYRILLALSEGRWLVQERQLLGPHAS